MQDLSIFDIRGDKATLKPECGAIWSEAVKILNNDIERFNLFNRIGENRNDLQTQLLSAKKVMEISHNHSTNSKHHRATQLPIIKDLSMDLDKFLSDEHFKLLVKKLGERIFILYWWPELIQLWLDFLKFFDSPVILVFSDIFIENAIIADVETKDIISMSLVGSMIDKIAIF